MTNESRKIIVSMIRNHFNQIEELVCNIETEKFEGVRSLQLLSLKERLEETRRLFSELIKDQGLNENLKSVGGEA